MLYEVLILVTYLKKVTEEDQNSILTIKQTHIRVLTESSEVRSENVFRI